MALFGDMDFTLEAADEAALKAIPAPQPAAEEEALEPVTFDSFTARQQASQAEVEAELTAQGRAVPLSALFMGSETALPTPYPEVRRVTKNGKAQLTSDEGERLAAYKDSKKIATIGVGFNLEEPANAGIFRTVTGFSVQDAMTGRKITKEQSQQLLDITLERATNDAKQLLPAYDKLSDEDQDAFVNFVFNVGKSTAGQFKNTLAAIQRGDGKAAAAGLRASAYYKQVGQRGERVAKALETLEGRPATTVAPGGQDSALPAASAPAALSAAGAGMVASRLPKDAEVHDTPGGKVGFIPDNKAAFRPGWKEALDAKPGVLKQATLADVLKHDELFKLYPELRDMPLSSGVSAGSLGEFGGSFAAGDAAIRVDSSKPAEDLLSTVLHEVQHAVQDLDGRPQGGSPDDSSLPRRWQKLKYAPEQLTSFLSAADQLADAGLLPDARDSSKKPLVKLTAQETEAVMQVGWQGVADKDAWETLKGLQDSLQEPGAPKLPAKTVKALDSAVAELGKLNAISPLMSREDLYLRIYGEAEARLTQANRKLSAAELVKKGVKPTDFDVPLADTLKLGQKEPTAAKVARGIGSVFSKLF